MTIENVNTEFPGTAYVPVCSKVEAVTNPPYVTPELGDAPEEMQKEADRIYKDLRKNQYHAETKEDRAAASGTMWKILEQTWRKDKDGKWVKKDQQTQKFDPEVDRPGTAYVPIMQGGEGSGNFGHEGRPGEVGGSGPGGGSPKDSLRQNRSEYEEKRMDQLSKGMEGKSNYNQKYGAKSTLSDIKDTPEVSDTDVAKYLKERNLPYEYTIDRKNNDIILQKPQGEYRISLENAKEYFDEYVITAWKDHYTKNIAEKK